MTLESTNTNMISNVCHECGGALESPIEFGHDDLLCSGGLAVTLYRCYCRICRSYWLHLGMAKVNSEEQAAVLDSAVA
ncbi:MAG: hypothetical protein Q7K29_05900 [Thermoleophilia bacterium]|nr:hypothetical protein [Thermoleophilia bacterium]